MEDLRLQQCLEYLGPSVSELFGSDSSGHDLHHSWRTMRNALYLQEHEGGDRVVVGIAALLHDVHRAMESERGEFVPPVESLGLVREMLSGLELDDDQVEQICFSIEHHEDYNWNGDNVDDLNAHIVQDADNLDAIGAVGIARAFSYGGAHDMSLYDPDVPINESDDYRETLSRDASTIHHFYHKAFKLAQNMNTATARELAQRRTDYMRSFVDEFMDEWDGRF